MAGFLCIRMHTRCFWCLPVTPASSSQMLTMWKVRLCSALQLSAYMKQYNVLNEGSSNDFGGALSWSLPRFKLLCIAVAVKQLSSFMWTVMLSLKKKCLCDLSLLDCSLCLRHAADAHMPLPSKGGSWNISAWLTLPCLAPWQSLIHRHCWSIVSSSDCVVLNPMPFRKPTCTRLFWFALQNGLLSARMVVCFNGSFLPTSSKKEKSHKNG